MHVGVLIGRFQPLHAGHISIIEQACTQCDKLLILVGSANIKETRKNPWSLNHRKEEIKHSILTPNFEILAIPDMVYNTECWVSLVKSKVYKRVKSESKVTLFCHEKEGNDYLYLFPEWDRVHLESHKNICGTQVRELIFDKIEHQVCEPWDYMLSDTFINNLKKEESIKKTVMESYPFPETLNFLTADALVVKGEDVLLVVRKDNDKLAMAGGFKNSNETLLETALRELKEETGLTIPASVLSGHIPQKIYDSPLRNEEVPKITSVFKFVLPEGDYPLTASDDALLAKWFPLKGLANYCMHEDHFSIIFDMLPEHEKLMLEGV